MALLDGTQRAFINKILFLAFAISEWISVLIRNKKNVYYEY